MANKNTATPKKISGLAKAEPKKPEFAVAPSQGRSSDPGFSLPKHPIQIVHIKEIIHKVTGKEGGYNIQVQRVEYSDGSFGKSVLIKKGFHFSKEGGSIPGKTKGFYLDDLAVIKSNWSKILRAMSL